MHATSLVGLQLTADTKADNFTGFINAHIHFSVSLTYLSAGLLVVRQIPKIKLL